MKPDISVVQRYLRVLAIAERDSEGADAATRAEQKVARKKMGKMQEDYPHIDAIARAVVDALEMDPAAQRRSHGHGRGRPLDDIEDIIERSADHTLPYWKRAMAVLQAGSMLAPHLQQAAATMTEPPLGQDQVRIQAFPGELCVFKVTVRQVDLTPRMAAHLADALRRHALKLIRRLDRG